MKQAPLYIDLIHNFLLDLVFPQRCAICKKASELICDDCLEKIKINDEQVCPICEKIITPHGRVCFSCRPKSPLAAMVVSTSYKENGIASIIHLFKYRFVFSLAEPLGKIISKAYLGSELPLPDYIVPVPLHKYRLRWRGFNQSLLLAKKIAANLTPGYELNIIEDCLQRVRYTTPQMGIKSYAQRKRNLVDAFKLNKKSAKLIKGKKLLLVDDVSTTGTTILECAKILKASGAKEVYGIVIARQEIKPSKKQPDAV